MGRLITRTIYFVVAFFVLNNTCSAQTETFDIIPSEEVFVSTNANILVAGENLFYKVSCFNAASNTLSDISKVAYVFLVNAEKEKVFEHKLSLKAGMASGDYYIPSTVKTGHYKLVSYTKWMLNNDQNPYFSTDIYLINPFSNRRIKKSNSAQNIVTVDSLVWQKKPDQFQNLKEATLSLNTTNNKFSTRSKVTFELNALNKAGWGNYAISVRRTDPVALKRGKEVSERKALISNMTFQLPEIRGEIISGTVLSVENNAPAANKVVGLSITGNETIFKNATTNNFGKFYFSLNEAYESGQLVAQLLNDQADKYKITFDSFSFDHLDQLSFHQLDLNENLEEWLLQKGINNQIESAYFDIKKDRIINSKKATNFFGKVGKIFVLDDYTRFNSVKETLVEVVQGAGVRTIDGERKIVVYTPETIMDNQLEDVDNLVLIDGVPIKNHEILIDFSPKEIKRMTVINELYFYGPAIYNGVLAVNTKKGNFSLPYNTSKTQKTIQTPIADKAYYNQNYDLDKNKFERIPDHRTQVLWMPNVTINEEEKKLYFYTSDVVGTYEILVEGFSNNGKYLKLTKYFEVE